MLPALVKELSRLHQAGDVCPKQPQPIQARQPGMSTDVLQSSPLYQKALQQLLCEDVEVNNEQTGHAAIQQLYNSHCIAL